MPSSTRATGTRSSPSRGRGAQEILQTLTAIDLPAIKYYWFAHGEIAGVRGTVSRTGYTGEDGFEVMVPAAMGEPCLGCAADRRGSRSA